MKLKIYNIVFIGILILGFVLRFYDLTGSPPGFNQDESSIGYSAYSILETGKDEYGKDFPIYFKSFGDQKLPVYIYSTVISEKVFGVNEFAVRFPSALFGFLSLPILFLLVRKLSGSSVLGLISMALLAISPWALLYNRSTYEVSISLFLFLIGTLGLIYALQDKRRGLFLFGALCFILSLYSYNLTRLLSPLLFLLIMFWYRKNWRNISRSEIVGTSIISIVLLIPFVATFFSDAGFSSAKGTLISSSAQVQASLLELRANVSSLPLVYVKLFFNSYILTFVEYLKHVISYLSVDFLFLKGDLHGNHHIPFMGQLFIFELPFLILGIVSVFKKKHSWGYFLLAWGIITILVASLTREAPQATRSYFLLLPLIVMSALGLYTSYIWFVKQKQIVRWSIGIFFSVILLINLIYFFTIFYNVFPNVYASSWREQDKALSLFLQSFKEEYDIVIDTNSGYIYTSYLFFTKHSPLDFQKTSVRKRDDSEGFSIVTSFGNITFRDIHWPSDKEQKNLIFVSKLEEKPVDSIELKRFDYPSKTVYFSVGQEIRFLPVTETAYVVFKAP